MKKIIRYAFLILVSATILSAGSCTVFVPVSGRPAHRTAFRSHVPPGQMKKMTGKKSAKAYAPGHNKKKKNNKKRK